MMAHVTMPTAILWFLASSLLIWNGDCLDNGLALTPPMGWLSWIRFRCNTDCKNYPKDCVSERLYMDMADRMVSDGYKDAGYEYVNIDDCWAAKERDSRGRLQPDPYRFPSGMKALADYVHARGLKLGIYGDMGTETCAGYPGSQFYLETDANTFAEWGIDSFKMDGCHSIPGEFHISFPIMSKFLNLTGRPILFTCEWPNGYGKANYTLIAETCNTWRNYHDIQDSWETLLDIVMFMGNNSEKFSAIAHPGAFSDPDQIIIGDFSLSHDQERVQMAMWSILAGSLLMSNDLRNIRKESRDLLLNKRLIAINQDPMGKPGVLVVSQESNQIQIWKRSIMPVGTYAVGFFNFMIKSGGARIVEVPLASLGLTASSGYNVTEGFTGEFVGLYKPTSTFIFRVNPSGVYLVIAKPLKA